MNIKHFLILPAVIAAMASSAPVLAQAVPAGEDSSATKKRADELESQYRQALERRQQLEERAALLASENMQLKWPKPKAPPLSPSERRANEYEFQLSQTNKTIVKMEERYSRLMAENRYLKENRPQPNALSDTPRPAVDTSEKKSGADVAPELKPTSDDAPLSEKATPEAAQQRRPFPTFLKVGASYGFHLVMNPHSERPSVWYDSKILQLGPGNWIRVQELYPPRPGSADEASYHERWLNFALVGSVILRDSLPPAPAAGDKPDQGPMPFPIVGTRYFFSGLVSLPYGGEVLETADNGWFCAQEERPQTPPRRWWVNIAVVSQAKEDKRASTAEASPQPTQPQQPIAAPVSGQTPPAPPASTPAPAPAPIPPAPTPPSQFFQLPAKEGIEYRVVTANNDANQLTSKVNGLLAEGWRLRGSVSIAISSGASGSQLMLAQAIVREATAPRTSATEDATPKPPATQATPSSENAADFLEIKYDPTGAWVRIKNTHPSKRIVVTVHCRSEESEGNAVESKEVQVGLAPGEARDSGPVQHRFRDPKSVPKPDPNVSSARFVVLPPPVTPGD